MEGIKGFHSTEAQNNQDTKYNKVFISDYFFYFGNKSFNLEDKFKEFIWKRQNYKYYSFKKLINELINFVKKKSKNKMGLIGMPTDLQLRTLNKKLNHCND